MGRGAGGGRARREALARCDAAGLVVCVSVHSVPWGAIFLLLRVTGTVAEILRRRKFGGFFFTRRTVDKGVFRAQRSLTTFIRIALTRKGGSRPRGKSGLSTPRWCNVWIGLP